MNFAKFLRTPLFSEHLRWLLLAFPDMVLRNIAQNRNYSTKLTTTKLGRVVKFKINSSFLAVSMMYVTLRKKIKKKKNEISIFCKLPKENKRNNKNVFTFLIFYLLSSSFFFLDFTFYKVKEDLCFFIFILSLCSNTLTLESIFEYIRQKLIKNMLILKFHPGMKCLHVFFSLISSRNEISSVFLTGVSSSQDKISSRQKRVHFTIDRDDFIPE